MLDIQTSNSVVADNLKFYIDNRSLKQSVIARKAGFSPQEFSDMLNGRRLMRAIDIANIINVLDNIDANDLFGVTKNQAGKR